MIKYRINIDHEWLKSNLRAERELNRFVCDHMSGCRRTPRNQHLVHAKYKLSPHKSIGFPQARKQIASNRKSDGSNGSEKSLRSVQNFLDLFACSFYYHMNCMFDEYDELDDKRMNVS